MDPLKDPRLRIPYRRSVDSINSCGPWTVILVILSPILIPGILVAKWSRKSCRKMDIQILWPLIRAQTYSLKDAREVFYLHCVQDPCWFKDYSEEEIWKILCGMK